MYITVLFPIQKIKVFSTNCGSRFLKYPSFVKIYEKSLNELISLQDSQFEIATADRESQISKNYSNNFYRVSQKFPYLNISYTIQTIYISIFIIL